MKIICIDNGDTLKLDGQQLTIGKTYEIINEEDLYYFIENDSRYKDRYLKSRFRKLRDINIDLLIDN